MELDAEPRSPAKAAGWHRLHYPVAVFLIVFGATRIASLLDWSGRHRDAARLLEAGGGTVTALLGVSAAGEFLLTVAALLAVSRRRGVWLLVALAGWSVESLALAVVAGVAGDTSRLVEHGVFLLVFAGLLAATYRWSAATRASDGPGTTDAAASSPAQRMLAPLTPAQASTPAPAPGRSPDSSAAAPPNPSATLASPPDLPVGRTASPAPTATLVSPSDAPDGPGAPADPSATLVSPPDSPDDSASSQEPPAGRAPEDPSATRAEPAPTPQPVSGPPRGDVTRRDLRVQRPGADGEQTGKPAGTRPPKAKVPESDVTRRDGYRIPSDTTRRDLRMEEDTPGDHASADEERATDDSGSTRSDVPIDPRDTPMRPRGTAPPAATDESADGSADETMLDREG